MTAVADLLTPRTADYYFNDLAARLTAEGFPATAWQVGNAGRTLTRVDAAALADLYAVVVAITKGGYLDESTGGWLTLLAKGVYDLDRVAAVYMQGDVIVACSPSAGPYTISPAALVVSDGTRRWRSSSAANVTVPSGGSATIRVQAEETGDAYNIVGSNITSIVTPASAGLSVSAASGSSWRVTEGAAEESDAALRARCRGRWATLGRGANLDAYVYRATTVPTAPTVTRAKVVPGSGDGTVTVYVAQATATASSPQVAAVQAAFDLQRACTDDVTIVAASTTTVQVNGTVKFSSSTYSTVSAQAAVTSAVTAYVNARGFGETVDLGGIYHAIYGAAPGVVDADLTLPAGDTVLTVSAVASASVTLTFTP